jgi:hypothetical protein
MVSWSVEWYVVVFFPQHTMVDAGVFFKTSAGGVGGRVCQFSTLGCYQNKKCKLI